MSTSVRQLQQMIGLPPCQPTVAVVEALDDAVKVVGAEIVGADVRDGFTRVLTLPAVKVRLDDAVVDAVDEAVEIASRQPVRWTQPVQSRRPSGRTGSSSRGRGGR